MLELADDWAWDFWLADDGTEFHLFFLVAPRSLVDPGHRHLNAAVGHAVSTDLRSWTRLPNALQAGSRGFDDVATWTGSVVRSGHAAWLMFYTGVAARGAGDTQQICLAHSTDLLHWHKDDRNPVLVPDARWYAIRSDPGETDWRDPWVFADPGGDGWHMLFTAAAADGQVAPAAGTGEGAGVVGHATSPDLLTWNAAPPLSQPGAGFEWLEVIQVEVVDGRSVLVFSCLADKLAGPLLGSAHTGGVWATGADAVTGPFDIARAYPLTDARLYSGRLVRERDGRWALMAFHNAGPDGRFVGAVSDPMPVRWDDKGRLRIDPVG